MKYLIMCEGTNEKTIIDMLIEYNMFTISKNDMIGETVYHARTLKDSIITTVLSVVSTNFTVLRIGDTQTDELQIPNKYKHMINDVVKICTKPELEILIIISENQIRNYNKQSLKPKLFSKSIKLRNGLIYDQSSNFYKEYFDKETLVNSLIEYKRIKKKSHEKSEKFLVDYLKESDING